MARRSPDLDEFYIESRTRRFFRRMSRRVRRLFYLLVFLAIAAVIAGPNLLSTDQARNLIIDRINERIPGSISIESMYLSWLGTQSMGGVELRGPDKRLIARIGELRVETGLVQLLSEKDNFGTIRMVAPQATLIFDESGHSNLDDALGFKQEKLIELANTSSKDGSTKEALKVRVPFRGSLMIESGQLTVVQPEVEKITFSGITATVQFASRQGPLVFAVNAKSKQGELSGEIDVEVLASGFNQAGEFRVLGTSEGLYKTDEGAELDVKAKLTNLPLDAIDRLASINAPERRGVLTRALGSRMDVQADVMVDADNIEADIQAGSPTLRARVLGETTAGHFVLKEPGQLSVQVTPTFFDDVAKALRMPPGLRLRETSTLLFKIKELNLPLQEGQTDLADLIVDTEVSFEDAQLVGDVAFGELVLRNTHATLATRALSKELILAFSSDVEHNGNPSTLSAHMNLANVVEANGTYTPESITGDLSLTAQGVSVQVMDQWLGFQGVLVEALGTKLDFTLETQINGQSSLMTLGFKAGDLSVEGAKIEVTDRVHLLNPVEVDYRFSAALANRFLKPTWNVALSQDVPLRASISNFSFPKPQPEGQLVQLKDIVLEAAVQLEKAHVEGVHELDGITAEKVELDFVGENLADTLVHFQGPFLPDNQESWIVDFGGQRFNVVGAMKLRETAQGAVDFVNASFDVQSDKVAFKLEGDLEDYDYMRLAKPIDLKFTLLPEHSKRLGLDHPELPVIASPAPVHVVLDPFETSLSKFDPYAMRFAGQVDFGRMGLTFPGRDYLSVLEEGKVDWRFSGPDKIFQVQADAKAMTESGGQQQKGEFTLELLVGDLLTADNGLNTQGMQLLLKTEGKALPTPLVEAVTGLPYLKDLFGQDMTGVFNTKLKQVYPPVGAVAFKLEGEPILVEGTFVLDKMVRLLDPRRPAYLKWKVT
ncbi:MAG: hypothetical protein KDK78_04940, partial [Chlamydiia bacterium]|nr:hypothetical protein [Chlamydiia bacterium]